MAPLTRLSLLSVALLAAVTAVAAPAAHASSRAPAPIRSTAHTSAHGDYLVVLKRSASVTSAADDAQQAGGVVRARYTRALRGYAASLTAKALATVRADADVAYVQPNRGYHSTDTQTGATWGLDRVDQRSATLNGKYFWRPHAHTGKVYVVDTGVKAQPQLGGAKTVTSTVSGSTTDCNGHGTHVSGIIGGSRYGVAKGSDPIGVKVLDCNGNGTSESVAAGLDYVLAHHTAGTPTVVNLSLGGNQPGHDDAVEAAVQKLIDAGITVVIAAGNSDEDACDYSPGLVPDAITVAASTKSDARASFSDYGACVDLYAPGTNIVSNWYTKDSHGNYTTESLSGTSMATPFVTGAALLFSQWYPSSTPAQVAAALTANATLGVISGSQLAAPGDLLLAKPVIPAPAATTHPNRILAQTALVGTATICSPSGKYCLTQRSSDHHLVLSRVSDGRTIWSNGTSTAWTYVRSDGNLVSYDRYGHIVWDAGASSSAKAELRVRDRGYIALVKVSTGSYYWRTRPYES